MDRWVCRQCFASNEGDIGISPATSGLGLLQVTPTEDGWSRGDRTFYCAVYDPNEDRLTSSLHGSGR